MKTIKNVLKLIMRRGVQVEKDYGRRGDTPPWAADTRPHATIVPAKNMKVFSWCMCDGGSLMIQLAFFSQCFSWIPKMKECCDPVIHWSDHSILWRGLRLFLLSFQIFGVAVPNILSLDCKYLRIHMNQLL